jgi:SAM-dependent methyltransferase
LRLGREREGAIFLDMGCCFGNDTRKIVADGFPIQNVIASDLRQEFWDLGHKLFRSTPASFPAHFVAGDAFDLAQGDLAPPVGFGRPALQNVTSLQPFKGHISVIHASSFFHLFDEEKQHQMARIFASLLSPEPGSIIFGCHVGKSVKGFNVSPRSSRKMFCHSPKSWRGLWDGEAFEKGTVRANAYLKSYESPIMGTAELLVWSVIKL